MNLSDFHIYQNYPALTDSEIIDNLPADLKENPTVLDALNTVAQKFADPLASPFFYNPYLNYGRSNQKINQDSFFITICAGPKDIEVRIDRFKITFTKIYIADLTKPAEYAEFENTQITEIKGYLSEIR